MCGTPKTDTARCRCPSSRAAATKCRCTPADSRPPHPTTPPTRTGHRLSGFGRYLLEGVLDVLADLLDARDALILLAFGLQVVISGDVSDDLFGLADRVLCGVLGLVNDSHDFLI